VQVYEKIATLELISAPGDSPSYSNLGFAVLGRALQNVLPGNNTLWEEYTRQYITEPLNMTSTGFNLTAARQEGRLVVGYDVDGSEVPLEDFGWMSPAGQMYSSVVDLGQLLSAIFTYDSAKGTTGSGGSGTTTTTPILKPESIREWLKPAYVRLVEGTGFGHPWEIETVSESVMSHKIY